MDSLEEMMQKRKPTEPPQVQALKQYVRENYDVEITVRSSAKHYVITVPGAVIAHRLRVEMALIIEQCQLDKKLVIHIGY